MLGAHVEGPAALLILRHISPSIWRASFAANRGRVEVAEALARTHGQLHEAASAWLADEAARTGRGPASANGSAETPSGPVEAESEMSSPGGWDNTSTVAARLGVCTSRVRQLLRAGVLTGRKAGGIWLIDRESTDAYEEAKRWTT